MKFTVPESQCISWLCAAHMRHWDLNITSQIHALQRTSHFHLRTNPKSHRVRETPLRKCVFGIGPGIGSKWRRRQISTVSEIWLSQLVPTETNSCGFGYPFCGDDHRITLYLGTCFNKLLVVARNRPPRKILTIAGFQTSRVIEGNDRFSPINFHGLL